MEQTTHCGALGEARRQRTQHSFSPAPAIRVSAALHLGGVAGLAIDPASWTYIAAALATNHVVLGIAGMWPRSTWLGPNLRRLPAASIARREIALTFDDGPDPAVTPRVLDLLDQHQAKASFFCVAEHAAAHRDIVGEVMRRGHTIENHTMRHPGAFAAYGMRRMRREIEAAQDALSVLSGRAPIFFRPPMGLRNPLLYPVLARLGLTHVSWTRRGFDTVDPNPARVIERLRRRLAAGDILALHDRPPARTREQPAILTALPPLLERAAQDRLRCVTLAAACGLALDG
jgi:peptidoglycan/xylan/chitin deacetylase (PgdA/CDA1 family)